MKKIYVVIVPDGMSDEPDVNGNTPMKTADKPYMNMLASKGVCGYVQNVPDGMTSESDVAIMSILGYNPKIYNNGRAPLEAVSMGLKMRDNDTAIRCNLVTLTEDEPSYQDKTIIDHSADEISSEESKELIHALDKELGTSQRRFFPGISYRNCILWEYAPEYTDFSRPHDILNRVIRDYLPKGEYGDLMRNSYDVLHNHPVNMKRKERGLKPANSIWLWSPGQKMNLPEFRCNASVISAVDLIKGISICAGMKSIDVDDATGNFHTNYSGKAEAAVNEIKNGAEFLFVHIEAPDECGHRGELENKIKSIEFIDRKIVRVIYEYLSSNGYEFKMAILPDHPTPVKKRTHTNNPVPFLIYNSGKRTDSGINNFYEEEVKSKSDLYIPDGHEFLNLFMEDNI